MQKRETKAINKLSVREILSLSFACGAYFFEFCGRNLVCFVIAYNFNGNLVPRAHVPFGADQKARGLWERDCFNGKYAPEVGKTRMRTAFITRADGDSGDVKL